MRNKLPIFFALILMAIAAMPWLRSLESQRWSFPTSATTVPPPEQAITLTAPPSPSGQSPTARGSGIANGINGENNKAREVKVEPKNSVGGGKSAEKSSRVPTPQDLLERAVRSVESRTYISARVKQQGELFGQQITGEGRYFEQRDGPIPRIRFELASEIGSAATSFVQVCNGVTLWTYWKRPDTETWSKIDAIRAMAAWKQAEGKLPPDAIASLPGLGGIGRLVRGLNAQFEFKTVVADQLGGLPVWRLTGGWRTAQLIRLLPDQKAAIEKGRPPDVTRLADQLPDGVVLFLGQDDCFPYRVDYLRGAARSPRRIVGLEFFELSFNGPIDAGQFLNFAPGSQAITDRTEEFVRTLGGG
jgi:hypothetical protein